MHSFPFIKRITGTSIAEIVQGDESCVIRLSEVQTASAHMLKLVEPWKKVYQQLKHDLETYHVPYLSAKCSGDNATILCKPDYKQAIDLIIKHYVQKK